MARLNNFGYLVGPTGSFGEDLSVTVRVRSGRNGEGGISLVNKLTKVFQGGEFRHIVADVNDRAAQAVQYGMASQLVKDTAKRGRPQRDDARLEASLLDENNRRVATNGFVVGIPSWLEQSPAALYWRGIEEGIPGYVPRNRILFKGPGGKASGPSGSTLNFFMKQGLRGRGATIEFIHEFPGYHYSRGGRAAYGRYQYRRRLVDALKRAGIPSETF